MIIVFEIAQAKPYYISCNILECCTCQSILAHIFNRKEGAGLEFDLNIPFYYQRMGIGAKMFDYAMEKTNATKFTATWLEDSRYINGESTNLTMYKKLFRQTNDANKAAFGTASGKWAAKHKFTSVVVEKVNYNGRSGIQATFTK